MSMFKKLAVLATAVEAARRYARSNPEKAGKILDDAAAFVAKQTKGKYADQVDGAVGKIKGVAGIPQTPARGPGGNGYAPSHGSPYGASRA